MNKIAAKIGSHFIEKTEQIDHQELHALTALIL